MCERGSYYELTDAELTASYPLGVSNEYAAGSDCITISTRSGAAGGGGDHRRLSAAALAGTFRPLPA